MENFDIGKLTANNNSGNDQIKGFLGTLSAPKESISNRIALTAGKAIPKLPQIKIAPQKPIALEETKINYPESTKPFSNSSFNTPKMPDGGSILKGEVVAATPEQYKGIIKQKATQYGVPASILSALIQNESGFNANSSNVNRKEKSYGLAQINTKAHNVTETQAKDPNFAIDFAAKRLSEMINKYGLYEGIQAYNTPGAIGSTQLINYVNKVLTLAGLMTPAYAKEPSKLNTLKKKSVTPKPAPKKAKGSGGPGQYENLPRMLSNLGNKTTDWGDKTRYEQNHPGLDFANRKGTPIPSTTPGTVTNVENGKKQGDNGFGNRVEVTDGNGYKHLYSHLDKIMTNVGQKVGGGQQIATMGDSGSTYSPSGGDPTHLDYRIVDAYNRYVSPYKYFQK